MKKGDKKVGCCFVEFENESVANNVLNKYNGKKINGLSIRLNRVTSGKEQNYGYRNDRGYGYNNNYIEKNNQGGNKKYSVRLIF